MKSARSGMSLLSVLMVSALMAILAVGFLRFIKSATNAQSNVAKIGEAASIATNIRVLLANKRACTETMKALNLNLTNGAEQNVVIKDARAQNAFFSGKVSNGILIQELKAQVSPADGNVHSVRVRAVLAKQPHTMGAPAYTNLEYVNVAVEAGVVETCLLSAPQNVYHLVEVEPVDVEPHATMPRLGVFSQAPPAGFDPDWGDVKVRNVPPNCNANCPAVYGPAVAFTAKGNRVALALLGKVGAGAFPGASGPLGARAYVELRKGNVVVSEVRLGFEGKSGTDTGFQMGSHVTPELMLKVTEGTKYNLRLKVRLGGQPVGPVAAMVARTTGVISHYVRYGD